MSIACIEKSWCLRTDFRQRFSDWSDYYRVKCALIHTQHPRMYMSTGLNPAGMEILFHNSLMHLCWRIPTAIAMQCFELQYERWTNWYPKYQIF